MDFNAIAFRSLLLSFFTVSSLLSVNYSDMNEYYKLAKSACGFHISIYFNAYWYGSAFSFNPILVKGCASTAAHELCVCVSNDGKIMAVHDGKKVPLVLGSIPMYKENIDAIKKHANLSENDKIGLYTLNRNFEKNWAGLTELEKIQPIISHKYPTTDYGAPKFIDLVRAVRDLDKRDETEEKIAYVHCKAGRGRSAVTVAAYLLHVCNKAGIAAKPAHIEEYLIAQRNRVKMNAEHRQTLERFAHELKESGNFEKLYARYKAEAEKRDQEFC